MFLFSTDVNLSLYEEVPLEDEPEPQLTPMLPDCLEECEFASGGGDCSGSRRSSRAHLSEGEIGDLTKSMDGSRKHTSESMRKPRVDVAGMIKSVNKNSSSCMFYDYPDKPRRYVIQMNRVTSKILR